MFCWRRLGTDTLHIESGFDLHSIWKGYLYTQAIAIGVVAQDYLIQQWDQSGGGGMSNGGRNGFWGGGGGLELQDRKVRGLWVRGKGLPGT